MILLVTIQASLVNSSASLSFWFLMLTVYYVFGFLSRPCRRCHVLYLSESRSLRWFGFVWPNMTIYAWCALSRGIVDMWICLCWWLVHSMFLTISNAHTSFFCYLVLSSYANSLDSARWMCVCCGIFITLGLVLKTFVVGLFVIFVGVIAIYLCDLIGSGYCPLTVFNVFYLYFNLLGC
jgi:hypothetical protein